MHYNEKQCRRRSMATLVRVVSFGFLFVLTACLEGSTGPVITEFRASPSEVRANSDTDVVLSWRVVNADGARMLLEAVQEGAAAPKPLAEDLDGQERFIIRPRVTATYRLIVSGPGGSSSREVTVRVIDDEDPTDPPDDPPAITAFTASATTVERGQEVSLGWSVLRAETVRLTSDRGLSEAVEGRTSFSLDVEETTTFTLTAQNEAGAVARSVMVQVADDPPANAILILIAGQSNAAGQGLPFPDGKERADDGVFMLTQGSSSAQWQWVRAEEPTHNVPNPHQHSFGVRLGNELKRATGRDVYLVPSAVGGTSISEWLPGYSSGYFDQAVARANYASADLGVPVSAVAWFQGENDSKTSGMRNRFVDYTTTVFDGFHDQLIGSPPIIFSQLSKRLRDEEEPDRNLAYQVIREQQRLMAAGAVESSVSGTGGTPAGSTADKSYYYMVVAHDLPMSDIRHVGRDGQKTLGSRFAHAFLTEIWEDTGARSSDRAGPRLEAIRRVSEDVIQVVTSRGIEAGVGVEGYFTVFVDGEAVPLLSAARDSSDSTAIRLEVAGSLPQDSARIHVRYMPPDDTPLYQGTPAIVHAVDDNGLKLPLPAFGLPVEPFQSNFLRMD